MRELKYVITDPMGIHARPAGELVKAAAAFPCNVTIEKDGRAVDAKRIMGVMSLGVGQGADVTISAEGADADDALAAIEETMTKEGLA